MRIVFMGTPDFAAASLRALIGADRNVVGVVSQPDRPKGRGHKLAPTDVKIVAEEYGLPVYQPEKIRNGELMPILEELKPDVIIVVAYGKILPDYVLNYPKYGCINVHASLLPKYRGAAPIQWAVINGEKVTGVTTMLMDKGVDTGDMLLKAETEIGENESAAELFDRLAVIGGELLIKTLDALETGTLTPVKQNEAESMHAPLISRETGIIDWTKSAHEIACLIRGMNSWPMASTNNMGEPLKISMATVSDEQTNKTPGTILALEKGKGMKIACGNGTLYVTEAQFSGSKRMNVEDYARGHKIETGLILGKEEG